MISTRTIEEVTTRLVQTYKPLEIYLFGSYAWGTPHKDSDLDLMIVVEALAKTRHEMLVKGHSVLIGMDVAKDLLLYTREEFDERAEDKMTLCYQVKREGRRIYAKA